MALLAGCGGGGGGGGGDSAAAGSGPLTAASFSATGPVLGKSEEVVIRFDASVDRASLVLDGTLAAEATGTWSATSMENDTYTLRPAAGKWTSGAGRDIAVSANGSGGGRVAGLGAKYLVRLELGPFDAATAVTGQADFASNTSNHGMGTAAQQNGFNDVYGAIAVAPDGKIFAADSSNNRVLGFDTLPAANGTNASIVLGQPDFNTAVSSFAPTRAAMGGPQGVSIAGGKMAVAEYWWNRVLVYNTIPAASGALPDVVVGQVDFTQDVPDCAAGLATPQASFLTPDGKLIVSDGNNHRVLIWNTVPSVNGQAADIVLGQARPDTCIANDDDGDGVSDTPLARTLNYPSGIWTDGQRLAIVDRHNNRILIWNKFPQTSFQPADVVLGQSNFQLSTFNDDDQDGMNGAATARTLFLPYLGIASNGVQLAVADVGNNRVLVWNSFPTANFQPADAVLGQADFVNVAWNDDNQDGGSDAQASARTLFVPNGVAFVKDKLVVTDSGNHRVLVFTSK